MSEHPPLRRIVEEHIAKARAVEHLTARVPVDEQDEHRDEAGESRMLEGRIGVTLARVSAEDEARSKLGGLEARVQELGDAREAILAEQDRVQVLITDWHRENDHLFEHHGEHTYLGMSTPDELERTVSERDAEIARLRKLLDDEKE